MKMTRYWHLFVIFYLSLGLLNCVGLVNQPSVASESEPTVKLHTYAISDAVLLNPERGFFTPYTLPGSAGFSAIRLTGKTLVHLNIRLDDYRQNDLPESLLNSLDQNFADIRSSGLKAIPRFSYNQGPYPDSEPDAPKAWILRHIQQLTPVLQKNSDVIAWLEAGFIGAWGEWHTSTNGLDNITDKRELLEALLVALPNRFVQVRYPANIIEMYPSPNDAVRARVAHHNDCFLSSDTDVGTYERNGINTIERDQAYLSELTRFTPMSGETCAPYPPRSECNSAIREMELLHFSALNEAYHKGIIRSWERGGCFDEINHRLGYRLALREAAFNQQVRPGGILNLKVELQNTGFAAPINPRSLYIVLYKDQSVHAVALDQVQPIFFQPGVFSFAAKLRLPSNLEQGEYRLALWLPDSAETLRNNPLYAIRLANENVWEENTGYNVLGQVNVSQSAPGQVQTAKQLTVLEVTDIAFSPRPSSTPIPTMTPLPTPTSVPVSYSAFDYQVSLDVDTLEIRFAFAREKEAHNAWQVFLDTDQNRNTGFSIGGIGAEFLLENGTLNAYAGSGNDWKWTLLEKSITFSNENQLAQWRLLQADLGNPNGFQFVVQLVNTNWDSVFVSPPQTFAP